MPCILYTLFSFSMASAQTVYMRGGTFANKTGKGFSRVALKPINKIKGNNSSYSDKSGLQNADNKYPTETANEKTQYVILTTNCGGNKPKPMAQSTINLTNLTDAEKQALQNTIIDRQRNIKAIEKEIARTR